MKRKIYLGTNVYEEAIKRIERLYDEFDEVVVGFSGGKDSTVVLNLAIEVAKKLNRLPVKTIFIDQEAEWGCVIDYIRRTMHRPEVEAMWYQMPLRISNSTSHDEMWLMCWKDGDDGKWIRDKEPDSLKENHFGTLTFGKLFNEILKKDITSQKACLIGGVRCEESPARTNGLTNALTYKDIAWGKFVYNNKKTGKERYIFYPIYDWTLPDVWKAINDNGWEYSKLYDYQYQHGISLNNMRVSNVHHETATNTLHYMQEVEPEMYQKVQQRLKGVNTEKTLGEDASLVKTLPYMFKDWREYRDFLLEGLVKDEGIRKRFAMHFKRYDKLESKSKLLDESFNREMVKAILKNDYHSVTVTNWFMKPDIVCYIMYKEGKLDQVKKVRNQYLEEEFGKAIYKPREEVTA